MPRAIKWVCVCVPSAFCNVLLAGIELQAAQCFFYITKPRWRFKVFVFVSVITILSTLLNFVLLA